MEPKILNQSSSLLNLPEGMEPLGAMLNEEQIDFAENHKMSWDECDTYADEGVNMGYGGDNGDAYDEPRRYDVSWRRACMCPDCGVLQPDY